MGSIQLQADAWVAGDCVVAVPDDELMAGDGEIPEEAIDVGTPARDAGRSQSQLPQG